MLLVVGAARSAVGAITPISVIAKDPKFRFGLKRSPERLLQSISELRLLRNDDEVSPKDHGRKSSGAGQATVSVCHTQ